jgi:hypothetical protein
MNEGLLDKSSKPARFKPTRRKGCGLLVALVCLAVIPLVIVWYVSRPRDLLAVSRNLGSDADFDQWVSDTDYMTAPDQDNRHIITRYNVVTGQTTRYRLAQPGIGRRIHSYTILSPDGKWLLWARFIKDVAIEVATGKTRTWVEVGDERNVIPAWMPDSRHWVTVPTLADGYMIIHSVIPGEKDVRCKALYKWDGRLLADTRVTTGGHLLSIEDPDYNLPRPVLTMHEYTLGATSQVVRVTKAPCPPLIENPTAVVSPSGDQIAWYGPKKTDTRLQAILHRLLPLIPLPKQRVGAIWISNADGSNLHELGVLSVTLDNDEFWNPNVLWLPSGKAISFEHEDGLYTVSVDQH